ncbi:MAG: PEP-CTERM sorting domain-containing protein [Pseudomonadota bacterium]
MKKSNKIIGCALVFMSSFCCSAFAIIMEGTFSGITGEFINENMDVTPDAKFFHENQNQYQPVTGSFWYDTDLSGPAYNDYPSLDLAIYSQEYDWVHTTLVDAKGESLEITSRGKLPYFSKHPKDSIFVQRFDDGNTFYDSLSLSYGDFSPPPQDRVSGPFRTGGLQARSNTPILDGRGLVQNFELSSELNDNKPIGDAHFETRGVLNGVSYRGDFRVQLNEFEIHIRDSASVPEPSSLFLFLGALIFLLLRAGCLLPARD